MVVPTTIGFPTKNDHFGVFWGYHHFSKHPYIYRCQLVFANFCFMNGQWVVVRLSQLESRYLRKHVLPVAPEVTFALAGRSATKVRAHATGNSSCRVDDDDDDDDDDDGDDGDDDDAGGGGGDDDDDDDDGMPEISRDVLISGPETAGVIVSWILYIHIHTKQFHRKLVFLQLILSGKYCRPAAGGGNAWSGVQEHPMGGCFHLFPTCRFTMTFNDIFVFGIPSLQHSTVAGCRMSEVQ